VASTYAIYTAFKLVDEITRPLDKMTKTGFKAGDVLKKSFVAAEKRVDAFGLKVKQVMSYAPLAIAGVGTAAMVAAGRQYIEFDNAVTKSGALFSDTQKLKGDAFKNALIDIGAEARKVAAATEFNAIDTAGALQKMAMAGMSAETSMELLAGTTDLATAAGTDLTTAVDIATDTLGALGMAATDKNLQRVSDAMAKTASTFNTDLQPMFEAITYAGPTFTTAGQSIDVLSASIGVLANAGIKGSSAGTALNAVFTQLSSEAKQNALGKLGIQTKDAQGNFLNLFDIVGQLQGKLAGMGNAQKSAILTEIFDTRGAKAMNILLGAGVDELKKYESVLQKSGGSAAEMANIMRGSLKNQIEVMKSALMELGFKFVEAFQQKGADIIGKLTNAINNVDVSSLTAKISAGITVIENLISILWRFRDVIGFVLKSMFLYKTIMALWVMYSRAAAVITGILNGVQMAYRSVVLGSTAATSALAFAEGTAATSAGIFTVFLKLASKAANGLTKSNIAATASLVALAVAQWAFNVAAVANPIGLIIMAIAVAVAALIALVVLVIKNWDKITEAVTRAFVWLKAFFASLGNSIKKAVEPVISWLKSAWSAAVDFFKSIWNGVVSFYKMIWGAIADFFKSIWNTILEFFIGIWDAITAKVSSVANWLTGVWQTITGAFSFAWSKVGEFFSWIWDGIKSKISAFVDWLKPIIDAIVGAFKPIVDFIGDVINGIGDAFSDATKAGDAALDAYDKANKKTGETAAVVEEVSPPDVAPAYMPFDASAFGVDPSEFAAGGKGGNGGKSALHGVYDVSGAAPALGGGVGRSSQSMAGAAEQAVDSAVRAILNVVRNIDANITRIAAWSFAPEGTLTPAPVTQGERAAYSLQERRDISIIELRAAQGTDAEIKQVSPETNIRLIRSGGNAYA
jgi:TP901 family phage tail tape measure protein